MCALSSSPEDDFTLPPAFRCHVALPPARMRLCHLHRSPDPIARIATGMDPRASRRVGVLSQHLLAESASPPGQVELQPLAGRASSSQGASTSYATATGRPSSYARVHGEVSRAPARWRRIDTVVKEQLREVKYEKAVGEGIAKVGGVWGQLAAAAPAAAAPSLACQQPPAAKSILQHGNAGTILALSCRSPSTAQRSAMPSRPAQVC